MSFNFFIIPLLIPFVIAGKTFMDEQDFKSAIQSMFRTKSIIFFLLGLLVAFLLQTFLKGSLFSIPQ